MTTRNTKNTAIYETTYLPVSILTIDRYGIFHQLSSWVKCDCYRYRNNLTYCIRSLSRIYLTYVDRGNDYRKGYFKRYFNFDLCIYRCWDYVSDLYLSLGIRMRSSKRCFVYVCDRIGIGSIIGALDQDDQRYTSRICQTVIYARDG